jgi:uncharacterized RDD family membrane protein YckC
MQYAGFFKRFCAYIIDSLILIFPSYCLSIFIDNFVAGIIMSMLYFPIFWASPIGATPGKYLLKIKIVSIDGSLLTFKQAFIRYVLTFASSVSIFIGYLFYFFTEKKQTFHDFIARTVVVETYHPRTYFIDIWAKTVKSLISSTSEMK